MSNSELNKERLILKEKRKLIDEEILEKQNYVDQITNKFTELSKALKGKYNFEKESIAPSTSLSF